MVECGAYICFIWFGVCVYSQPQLDPNSLFCFVPNKGAPVAFTIMYGLSALTHWYQCWYVYTLSAYISLVLARPGSRPAHYLSKPIIRRHARLTTILQAV